MSFESSVTPTPYSRKNPFPAELLCKRLLTKSGSEKETWHFELGLAGSGLLYECGDSLGVLPSNCPELVDNIIAALHASGDELVPGNDGGTKTLRQALQQDYVITAPSRQFIEALVLRAEGGAPTFAELLAPDRKADLEKYMWGLEYIDLLLQHPSAHFTSEEFVKTLRKLQPRLYSIASSQKVAGEAVHLTVAAIRYTSHGRQRKGVASTFLADRVGPDIRVPVFVHSAKGFRLPDDPSVPIIMVGPGTGVAPFRAFLQQRAATPGSGKNWLFFGDQRRAFDFLYEEEFAAWEQGGVLTRFSTAFSRDQANKIYVQNRMLEPENAKEIWRWIDQEGAHFFVCGDAQRMAKDVDSALHQIVAEQGGKTPEQAMEYVEGLRKAKRYKRDVY